MTPRRSRVTWIAVTWAATTAGELEFGWVLDGRAIQDLWITYPKQGEKERGIGTRVRFFERLHLELFAGLCVAPHSLASEEVLIELIDESLRSAHARVGSRPMRDPGIYAIRKVLKATKGPSQTSSLDHTEPITP